MDRLDRLDLNKKSYSIQKEVITSKKLHKMIHFDMIFDDYFKSIDF
jgi:hypothetical protein